MKVIYGMVGTKVMINLKINNIDINIMIWWAGMAFFSQFFLGSLFVVIEPIFVFIMSYLSYLTAELFHLSGIMR